MKVVMLMSALAFTACGTTATTQQPTLPRATAVECPPKSDCRIGSTGTKLTGATVDLAGRVHAVALPSGELVPVR